MILLLTKILAITFALLVVSKSILSYRQGKESFILTVFWSITWVAIALLALYPSLLTALIGPNRAGVGTVLGVGLIFLYFVLYRVYVKADRVERELQSLIQKLALRDLDEK